MRTVEKGKTSRRAFLKTAALGAAGLGSGAALAERISNLWVAKASHGGAVLNLHEMLTLGAIASQIIPSDETPGAREAGVVDYIDTKLKNSKTSAQAYQNGLQEADQVSNAKYGAPFIGLALDRQRDVLKSLEKSQFFQTLWTDTVEAFCRSPLGQKVMGYPGAAQPHGYHDIASPPTAHR